MKRALITLQLIFISTGENDEALLREIAEVAKDVKNKASGLPNPSYVSLMLDFFAVNLLMRKGDV